MTVFHNDYKANPTDFCGAFIFSLLMLLTASLNAQPSGMSDVESLLAQFDSEPDILQVHFHTLKYAGVDNVDLDQWSRRARWSNLIPSLQGQISWLDQRDDNARHRENLITDDDGFVALDQVQNHHFFDFRSRSLSSLRATFDLRGIIYDRNELAIAKEVRQAQSHREMILIRVTDIYFERRERQLLNKIQPPQNIREKIALEIEIQTLTAQLDAFTNGWFSRERKAHQTRNKS